MKSVFYMLNVFVFVGFAARRFYIFTGSVYEFALIISSLAVYVISSSLALLSTLRTITSICVCLLGCLRFGAASSTHHNHWWCSGAPQPIRDPQ
ncbi:hypothetical protein FKM82_005972 [Ascaphus truei]